MITKSTAIAGALFATFAATAATATPLTITITNTQGEGGLAIAPFYTAFHNASFDAFEEGEAASAGLEQLAEVGSPGLIASERLDAFPDSQGRTNGAPLAAGQTATINIDVDGAENQYFTFLSMILPSNDVFVGNDDALRVFDTNGLFLGPKTLNITGLDAYDAGTELTDPTTAPGVAVGTPPAGADENGVITQNVDLSAFIGLPGIAGPGGLSDANNPGLFDSILFGGDGNVNLLTVTITQTAPVPLPASSMMLLSGLGFAGFAMRRRQKKNKSA